jgi:hypothetical protein
MIQAGRKHGLAPRKVAETIWQALTSAHQDTRYAPAQHPMLEQGLARILPRRLLDGLLSRYLKVRPGRNL